MKTKTALLFFILFLGAFLVWLRQSQKNTLPAPTDVSSQGVSSEDSKSDLKVASLAPQVGSDSTNGSSTDIDAGSKRSDLLRQAMEAKNIPVDFYGQVVDQMDSPLSGVKINLRVRHWNIASLGSSIPISLETDAAGRFHVTGVTGDGFGIEVIQKTGYELEPNSQRSYAAVGGSLGAPVVFKMWGTDIHEPLIAGKKSFRIEPDGRLYVINLQTGAISDSGDGDLKIWVKRPATIVLGQRYDWSCKIDVINGGLLEEVRPTSSMFSAPIDGYSKDYLHEQKVGSGWGDSTGTRRFYLKLNNGQVYGRVSLEVSANYNDQNPGRIRIEYAINPTGSRILK